MTVSETTLTADEGSSGTYAVRLNTEPSTTVTVTVTAAEDDNRVDETVNPSYAGAAATTATEPTAT